MSGNFPQGVKADMGTNTIGNQNWKLTLIRDYTVSQQNEIEYAMFGYGRTASELEDETRESAHLPTGLIHLLERSKLTSEALAKFNPTGAPEPVMLWQIPGAKLYAVNTNATGQPQAGRQATN